MLGGERQQLEHVTLVVIGAVRLAMMRQGRFQQGVFGGHMRTEHTLPRARRQPAIRAATDRKTSWNMASVSRPVFVL